MTDSKTKAREIVDACVHYESINYDVEVEKLVSLIENALDERQVVGDDEKVARLCEKIGADTSNCYDLDDLLTLIERRFTALTERHVVSEAEIEAAACETDLGQYESEGMRCFFNGARWAASRNLVRAIEEVELEAAIALRKLVVAIEAVHISPKYERVWETHQLHEGQYSGPNYYAEFDAAKKLLAELKRRLGQ